MLPCACCCHCCLLLAHLRTMSLLPPLSSSSPVPLSGFEQLVSDRSRTAACQACTCGIASNYLAGLTAAGVRINGQPIQDVLTSQQAGLVNDLLTSCAGLFAPQLLQQASLGTAALTALASVCDIQSDLQDCPSAPEVTSAARAAGGSDVQMSPSAPAPAAEAARSGAWAPAGGAVHAVAAALVLLLVHYM
jgi:hypothetical protein